ncbi:HAMP domain-containing sensor histidine kinase [Caulobacter sp. 17J80-11]|uniref:HAMP domain-containing sensor histidine kinase n=1 Tax=Caulobacter sp. 17J80-11 TaxID=2763502 RepID=UPI0016538F63|nr:HAMP domain-containing sensor histidine kinase [Caulobacter sp. 17J80-11]MBC6980499.1 HAMP domain-containing histidine kinase [Caulobacter sp. 17J80-11]
MRLRPWILPVAALTVAAAALAAGFLIVGHAGESLISRQQAATARSERDYFVTYAREEGVEKLAAAIERRERLGSADGFHYALVDKAGRTIAGADLQSIKLPASGWRTVAETGQPRQLWRVLAQPLGRGMTLVVAEDLEARDAFRDALFRGTAWALLVAVVMVAAVGVAFNALMLRRARDIAHTAGAIAAGDLSARAAARADGDVFDRLGLSLNAMLTRIEELMTGLRTVTDSLAHDLRSPLMRVEFALDRAAEPDLPPAELAAVLDHARGEVDAALATLSALMEVARAETGLSGDAMGVIDLAALADEMGDLFSPVIEDAGQLLVVDTPQAPLPARVHETLLRQALGNLLHNAAVHAGPGADVRLQVAETPDGQVRMTVSDTGPGVPAEHLGRVAERFVRVDSSRSTPGAGLGLAIVAACAKLHGGRLVLSDNAPGLMAAMEFPRRRRPA